MLMKKLEIYTLCRSGNHAIIFWIIHNICNINDKYQGECYWNTNEKLYYYNNCNHVNYNNCVENYNYLIKSYEDTLETSEDCTIIVRDFRNFLASRYKKYGSSLGLNSSYLQDYEKIKTVWKNLCHKIINNEATGIIYNKWLIDKEYRDKIGQQIGIPNVNDNISFVSDIGEGSSFIGINLENNSMEYLNRFDKSVFHNCIELYDKINYDMEHDIEIVNINKALF